MIFLTRFRYPLGFAFLAFGQTPLQVSDHIGKPWRTVRHLRTQQEFGALTAVQTECIRPSLDILQGWTQLPFPGLPDGRVAQIHPRTELTQGESAALQIRGKQIREWHDHAGA